MENVDLLLVESTSLVLTLLITLIIQSSASAHDQLARVQTFMINSRAYTPIAGPHQDVYLRGGLLSRHDHTSICADDA